jgi:hypothetical protein
VRSLGAAAEQHDTGPIGPVAVSALLFLVVASPLMRGGNRHVALIVLEAAALAFLAAMSVGTGRRSTRSSVRGLLVAFLFLSPVWLALVYLLPLPAALWNGLPGRAVYSEVMAAAGIRVEDWLPLSLVPVATTASLLAGIPVMAAFLAGYRASLKQLKLIVGVLVGMAFLQVVFGMLQLAGGTESALYFGNTHRAAAGTFANKNHFANYIAMALAGYFWLASIKLTQEQPAERNVGRRQGSQARKLALWISGAVLLIVGLLMSGSRGALVTGLPAAIAAFILVMTVGSKRPLRTNALLVGGALAVGFALVGFDALLARFDLQRIAADIPFRAIQATTTLEGAMQLWPWGSGWGTYYWVYPRFQPPDLIGTADYAHHDYAQMLFEGGIFAVLLMTAFGWLTITRAVKLFRGSTRRQRLHREEIAAAICGLGLLGFLLHSLIEFNMHIPANAIAAALLAGVYLRPLDREQRGERAEESSDD